MRVYVNVYSHFIPRQNASPIKQFEMYASCIYIQDACAAIDSVWISIDNAAYGWPCIQTTSA